MDFNIILIKLNMPSKVRFGYFDDINLNEINNVSGQTQFFKNIKILCRFNSKIHLVSYLHLQFINNIMLFIVVTGSFISGLIDTINHNDENPNKDLKLIFGCFELFLAMLITFYKQSKIAENQQDHYHLSNNYKILLNKINTDILLINTSKSIYITNIECIRDITDQFNNLIINAPIIPYYILKKYNIKDSDLGNNKIENITYNNENQKLQNIKSDNVQILESIVESNIAAINIQDVPLSNLKNQINTSPKKNRKYSLNKSYSIKDLNSINEYDINNYKSFINKINIKNEQKYTNNVINNFKNAFDD
tara:strand:+ start:134 stop:1054 length:921 start_codon:yes stop_codon:yes gene_type:complete